MTEREIERGRVRQTKRHTLTERQTETGIK